ncbi:MAG: 2'-deoxycytidine 5'-triphosphate deaminase, partial [Hyphomonadaceae bacterium]|nr:2'-deoxycytidine 5'-triphosphate deaminase [Hyphomonadaceae bacterium]
MGELGAGVLPDRELALVLAQGGLASAAPLDADQIQPASLDLRLGAVAYRLRASFLP